MQSSNLLIPAFYPRLPCQLPKVLFFKGGFIKASVELELEINTTSAMGHRLTAELLGKTAGTELVGWGQSPIEAVHCGMLGGPEKTSVPCCLFIWEQGDIP